MTHGIFDEEDAAARAAAAQTDKTPGPYALLVQGQVKGTFSSNGEALRAALEGALDDFSVIRVQPQAA